MNNFDKNVGEKVSVKEGTETIKSNDGKIYKVEQNGIDDDGKPVYTAQQKPQWISPTKLKMPDGRVTTIDPNEFCCEVYNPNLQTLFFVNDHYNPIERAKGPRIVKIPHDSFGFLPHRYFICYVGYIGNTNGDKVTCVVNHGDMMFKGNKKLSRPEEKVNYY